MGKPTVRQLFEHAVVQKHRTEQRELFEMPEALKEVMPDESLEIIKHFGINAPHLLNDYCINLEDALIEQARTGADYREKCIAMSDEIIRLRELITTEDSLKEDLQST